jgi:CheY-like chemotaxis protein
MVSKIPNKRTLRILVCDPDQEFVEAVERILGSEGHTVVAEADLCKAARLALQSTPDVIVLPSEFADDPNADLITELIHSLTPRPAILLTMQMVRFDLARKAWQKGADHSVFKPLLGEQELKAAIDKAHRGVAKHIGNDPQLEDEIMKPSQQTEKGALLR